MEGVRNFGRLQKYSEHKSQVFKLLQIFTENGLVRKVEKELS